MLFENLYQEADKAIRRRWWISLAASLLLVFCYTANAWMTTRAADIYLASASFDEPQRFLKASALCSELPNPEQFERVNARAPRYTDSSAQVFHGYRSARDFDEVTPTFLIWFESNGWKRVKNGDFSSRVETIHPNRQLIFSKDKFTVNIVSYYADSDGFTPPANYEFSCRYQDISFAIYD